MRELPVAREPGPVGVEPFPADRWGGSPFERRHIDPGRPPLPPADGDNLVWCPIPVEAADLDILPDDERPERAGHMILKHHQKTSVLLLLRRAVHDGVFDQFTETATGCLGSPGAGRVRFPVTQGDTPHSFPQMSRFLA